MRSLRLTVVIAGVIVAILGIMILVGWHAHNSLMIQLHPSMLPMQYNTALRAQIDKAVLVFGLFLAVQLTLAIRFAQTARQRAREAMSANRDLADEITARRRIEQSLRQAEEKYRSIFENTRVGIFQISPEGRFLIANPALARILGYETCDNLLKDKSVFVESLYHRKEDRQEFIRQLKAHGAIDRLEAQFHRQDGALIWLSLTADAVHDSNGSLLYYEGTAVDVTESKSYERQLLHAQKMDAIGTLTSGIAHDFNNILTAIHGHASLLSMKIDKESQLVSHVRQILNAVDLAAKLTRSLLTFCRNQDLDQSLVDVNEIVSRVEGLIKMLLRKDIKLRSTLMNGSLVVMADSVQIEQVLINLACNARDAMPDGGMLTIASDTVVIDHEFITQHGFGTAGRFAVLSITDTGIGVDEKIRELIFEPFFTTKDVGKGTGLGLSTSCSIVKQHHGYINFYSEPGVGTTFEIYLPLVDQVQLYHSESLHAGTTILHVEDNSIINGVGSESDCFS